MTVRTAIQASSTTNAGLSCGATLISLLAASDHFYATITSATSGLVGPTGDASMRIIAIVSKESGAGSSAIGWPVHFDGAAWVQNLNAYIR